MFQVKGKKNEVRGDVERCPLALKFSHPNYCRSYELAELYLHSHIFTGTNIIYASLNNFKSYGKTAAFI
jgi:hypothetical protein